MSDRRPYVFLMSKTYRTISEETDPGTVRFSELRAHLSVCDATARALIAAHRIPDVGLGGIARYRWIDIWRAEGSPWVAPCDWPARKASLLRPSELSAHDPEGRSARTFRRLLARGTIPSIVLSPNVRRVRADIFQRVISHL